jgi:hypothetical protein
MFPSADEAVTWFRGVLNNVDPQLERMTRLPPETCSSSVGEVNPREPEQSHPGEGHHQPGERPVVEQDS